MSNSHQPPEHQMRNLSLGKKLSETSQPPSCGSSISDSCTSGFEVVQTISTSGSNADSLAFSSRLPTETSSANDTDNNQVSTSVGGGEVQDGDGGECGGGGERIKVDDSPTTTAAEGEGGDQSDGVTSLSQCELELTPEEISRQLKLEAQMRASLNQQTVIQYRQFAQEQFPKEPLKQEELVAQLQDQYFKQYITQVYERQIYYQRDQLEKWRAYREHERAQKNKERTIKAACETKDALHAAAGEGSAAAASTSLSSEASHNNGGGEEDGEEDEDSDNDSLLCPEPPELVPASLWTRRDLAEFKREILKTQRECCIKIGSLATATICVPTHPHGRHLFWEFATDNYDLGFGVYFRWTLHPPDNVTIQVSESSDEEEEEDGDEFDEERGGGAGAARGGAAGGGAAGGGGGFDNEMVEKYNDQDESGRGGRAGRRAEGVSVSVVMQSRNYDDPELEGHRRRRHPEQEAPCDELIPIFRRDCHKEVYCGSHLYPGRGVYVLKFDNSFSLWRSKWLYYRVYYTK